MQLFVPVLLITNILGLTFACTQYKIEYIANTDSCEDDAGTWRNHCNDLAYKYLEISNNNQGRLGHTIQGNAYCDPCGQRSPRCHCRIDFWRFREWMGTDIPIYKSYFWNFNKNLPPGRISDKTVHCD
ncbi:hypothetical protein M3J09_008151 [Ascochyta lentis]